MVAGDNSRQALAADLPAEPGAGRGDGHSLAGLRTFVMAAAVLAAWGAARWAFCLPLLWVGVMFAWLALPVERRGGLRVEWLSVGAIVLAIGFAVAQDHELALRHTLAIALAVLLFGLARLAAPTDRQLEWVVLGIAATSILAFMQVSGGLTAAAGDVSVLAPGLREAAATRLEQGRAFGSSALPGHFAALLLTAAPLLWRWMGRAAWPSKLLPAGALASVAVALFLTRSLAAVAVVAMLVLIAAMRRHGRVGVLVAAVAATVLAGAVVASRNDIGSLEPVRLRLVNWRTAAWVLAHNPLVGVGLGGIGQAGLNSPSAGENISPYSHNSYLQLATELGIMGLPIIVTGVLALVALLRRSAASDGALTLAVAVVPVHNLVDFSLYSPEVLLPWATFAGVLAARARPLRPATLRSFQLVPILVVGCLLAALEWAGESALSRAFARPGGGRASAAAAAARWTPWRIRPVFAAAELALGEGESEAVLAEIDGLMARRHWVQPRSAGWSEARACLLLAQGRRGEALVWVREAARRRDGGGALAELEERCR